MIGWLKMLENHSAQQGRDDPVGSYDFTWIWKELGLGDERRWTEALTSIGLLKQRSKAGGIRVGVRKSERAWAWSLMLDAPADC